MTTENQPPANPTPPGYQPQFSATSTPPTAPAQPATPPFVGQGTPRPKQSAPESSSKKKQIIGIVLILALIIVLVLTMVTSTRKGADEPARTAQETVQAYFDALQQGDADAVLKLAQEQPKDKTFLTDEILQAAMRDTPITDVTIGEPVENTGATTVDVSYKIGGQKVDAVFALVASRTTHKLRNVTKTVLATGFTTPIMDVQLNGVAIKSKEIEVFPGRYTVAPVDSSYVIDKPGYLVAAPESARIKKELPSPRVDVRFNDEMQAKLRAAAKPALTKCLNAKKLDNPECGIRFIAAADEKTMKCSVVSGDKALDQAVFFPSDTSSVFPDQGLHTAWASVKIDVRCTMSGVLGSYRGDKTLQSVKVDTSKDPYVVTFR